MYLDLILGVSTTLFLGAFPPPSCCAGHASSSRLPTLIALKSLPWPPVFWRCVAANMGLQVNHHCSRSQHGWPLSYRNLTGANWLIPHDFVWSLLSSPQSSTSGHDWLCHVYIIILPPKKKKKQQKTHTHTTTKKGKDNKQGREHYNFWGNRWGTSLTITTVLRCPPSSIDLRTSMLKPNVLKSASQARGRRGWVYKFDLWAIFMGFCLAIWILRFVFVFF